MKQDDVVIYSDDELKRAIEDVRRPAELYLEDPNGDITVNGEAVEDEKELLERELELFDSPSDVDHVSVEFVWDDQWIGTLWLEFWTRAFSPPAMYTLIFNKADSHLPEDAPHPIDDRE